MDRLGGDRIHLGEAGVHRGAALRLDERFEAPADHGIDRWQIDEAAEQRPEPEPRAAHDDGEGAAGGDGGDRFVGQRGVAHRVDRLVRVDHVDEVVGYAPQLLGRRLGGADVEAAVDLHAVGADDLAAEGLREGDRQPGLSDGGRTGQHHDRGPRLGAHLPSRRSTSASGML